MSANADQITYWNEVAGAKWVANQEQLDRLMTPLTAALLDGAAPHPGETILDVGCGCGELALRLAAAVGPNGRVDAVDISEPMLAHARARDGADAMSDRAPVQWQRADAMVQSFTPDHDLVTSRFGVMFFDDRPRAFANLRRAVKPGGRFAFLTWRTRPDVEWMQAPLDWLGALIPAPDIMDGDIGPFAMADASATSALLADAGFAHVESHPIDRTLTIGTSVDDALAVLSSAGPAAAALRDVDPGLRREALSLLREHLERHLVDGHIELRGACWLYRGKA